MLFWFIVAVVRRRNDIADVAWGTGFIIIFLLLILLNKSYAFRTLFAFLLVLLWGIRLTLHIYFRNRKKKEDYRYKEWREDWGGLVYIRSFFQIFMLQGLMMLLIAIPFLVLVLKPGSGINPLDMIGGFIWGIGFYFETIGDFQLAQFMSDPKNKGKILTTGLWKYTRHPNYFGEVTMWWGIFIITLSSPFGLLSIVSPITITYLILCVSGIPLLEKRYKGNKEFEKYKKNTSPFFPWFPPKQ